jgi:hypothetical protein
MRKQVQGLRVLEEAAGVLVKTMRMAIEAARKTKEPMKVLLEAVRVILRP